MIFFYRPLFSIQCLIGLTVVVGLVTCSLAGGHNYETEFETLNQLDSKIKSLFGSSWWLANSNYRHADKSKRSQGMSKSSSSSRPRVTIRPKDATTMTGHKAATNGSKGGGPRMTTEPTAAGAVSYVGPTIFNAENDCMSANNGRPCVCYMTDFLDSLNRRLDETADENDTTVAVVSFACPSYKVVPSAFVVSPSPVVVTTAVTTAVTAAVTATTLADEATTVFLSVQSSKETDKYETGTDTVPVWKEVDFDYVLNYRLEKSKDGELHNNTVSSRAKKCYAAYYKIYRYYDYTFFH